MIAQHAHTWYLANPALRRYRCACGAIGHAPKGSRRTIVPFACQHELDGRKHCGAPAVHVTALRTQSRCVDHAPAREAQPLINFRKTHEERHPMKKTPLMLRQGDVLIVAVDAIPSTAKPIKRTTRGVVLAEGEVTGHAHRIPARHASLYRSENDARYLRVGGTSPAQLKHEEHSTVTIPPGNYRVTIHTEYVPGELPRRVAD